MTLIGYCRWCKLGSRKVVLSMEIWRSHGFSKIMAQLDLLPIKVVFD